MAAPHKIGNVTAGLMVTVAILIDCAQALLTISVFLLPLSVLVTFISTTMFFLWFGIRGVKYIGNDGGKKLLIMLATTVAELAPVINALPATTFGVIGIIVQTRFDDAREAAGGKVTPRTAMAYARQRRMQASRANRENSAREGREDIQATRHAAPANDNAPEAANDNSADSYRNAA